MTKSKLFSADPTLPQSEIVDLDVHRAKKEGFHVPASLRPTKHRKWRHDGKTGRPRKTA